MTFSGSDVFNVSQLTATPQAGSHRLWDSGLFVSVPYLALLAHVRPCVHNIQHPFSCCSLVPLTLQMSLVNISSLIWDTVVRAAYTKLTNIHQYYGRVGGSMAPRQPKDVFKLVG